jgi:hypothetical protein
MTDEKQCHDLLIDYGSYISCFDRILSPMVRSLTSHVRHGVTLKGGLWNRGGGG